MTTQTIDRATIEQTAQERAERLAALREERQRVSLDAISGDKQAGKRAADLAAQIGTLEGEASLAQLALSEADRRETEQRAAAEAERLAQLEATLAAHRAGRTAALRAAWNALCAPAGPL